MNQLNTFRESKEKGGCRAKCIFAFDVMYDNIRMLILTLQCAS